LIYIIKRERGKGEEKKKTFGSEPLETYRERKKGGRILILLYVTRGLFTNNETLWRKKRKKNNL